MISFKEFADHNTRLLSLLFFLMLTVFVAYFSFFSSTGVLNTQKASNFKAEYQLVEAVIGGENFQLAVSDTEEKRQLGLSNLPSMAGNQGMLFVFDQPGLHGFWMKDMNFSIDIIWLDHNLKVVDFKKNLTPGSYLQIPPKIFFPKTSSMYVVELNAGLIEEMNLTIGSQVKLLKEI